ncbi:hypothetical protein [Nonomuraea turkmeniaca]|uniref:hypothetical protein n=1 Tax=Nonomuraea turkmeniaca TaxID=103838 RepID=UPI00147716B9|nr:hypothetical protein [Nonomuraea turkmeniaca]
MASGQVSIWVPVVVAVLGIIGVIAGQFVSAWREDRRWRRELAREDLRWEREQQRECQSRESEAAVHWRNERLRLYSGFVAVVRDWVRLLRQASYDYEPKKDISPETLSRLRELETEAMKLWSEIGLIGSEAVDEACADFVLICRGALTTLEAHVRGEGPPAIHRQWIMDQSDVVVDCLRSELGMKPFHASDPPQRQGSEVSEPDKRSGCS